LKKFSCISIDHAHEQLNAVIKGDGGAIGLTSNDISLTRWTVAGPEIVRVLNSFEDSMFNSCHDIDTKHNEQRPAFQRRFRGDVKRLLEVLFDDNPFSNVDSNDLIVLCTRVLADPSVSETVKLAQKFGQEQMTKFINERFKEGVPISATVARNKLHMFPFKPASKKMDSRTLKVTKLKTDCELFF
jgi:hypothetical protein